MDLFKIEDCDVTICGYYIKLQDANQIFNSWLAKQKLDLKEKIEVQEEKLLNLHNLYESYGDLIDL